MFRPILGHLQVVSYSLENEVSYRQNYVIISYHLDYIILPVEHLTL